MKPGTALTRAVILLLLAAVLAYLGFYLWQGLSDPYQLVVTYSYEIDEGVALSGVVVRSEETIEGRAALTEILPQEGERVSAGSVVALVYQNEQALADRRRARALEQELEQLRYAARSDGAQVDAKELDSQLTDALSELRRDVSTGSLDDLEDRGLDVRGLVVRRTAQAGAEDLPQLQAAAAQVEGELASLSAASAQTTRRVAVSRGGVFSGLADGYETILTPQVLEEMTPASLDRLRRQQTAAPGGSLGKLITDSTWRFAADLSEEDSKGLEEGRGYTLAFSGDFNEEVTMTLERLGAVENGRRLAVFSCDRYLNKLTLCRFVNANLVLKRHTGVRIPDKALRVRDNGDGTTTPVVYTLVGRQIEIKTVEIVWEGEGFYLVQGTDRDRKVLRPGDTIVLSNRELYEGKVVA